MNIYKKIQESAFGLQSSLNFEKLKIIFTSFKKILKKLWT
jgi:hypothetical protein